MVKNRRIEAALRQLVEVIKEEIENGCEKEANASPYVTALYVNKNPDIVICKTDTSAYLSIISTEKSEVFVECLSKLEQDFIKASIEEKEREIRVLKGLQA